MRRYFRAHLRRKPKRRQLRSGSEKTHPAQSSLCIAIVATTVALTLCATALTSKDSGRGTTVNVALAAVVFAFGLGWLALDYVNAYHAKKKLSVHDLFVSNALTYADVVVNSVLLVTTLAASGLLLFRLSLLHHQVSFQVAIIFMVGTLMSVGILLFYPWDKSPTHHLVAAIVGFVCQFLLVVCLAVGSATLKIGRLRVRPVMVVGALLCAVLPLVAMSILTLYRDAPLRSPGHRTYEKNRYGLDITFDLCENVPIVVAVASVALMAFAH